MLNDEPHRLPRSCIPRRYELHLVPDLERATFTGSEVITVDIMEPTESIVANAAALTIGPSWVTCSDGRRLDASITLDPVAERVEFTLESPLAPGQVTLHCEFSGSLDHKLKGFYRSHHIEPNGAHRVLGATQLEATDARRVFPCWDQPDCKATFAITLDVAADLTAVSNGPQLERTPIGGGLERVRFAPTMVMSTYLVAFLVGHLEASAPVDVGGVPLRVLHVPGKAHLTGFGLEVAEFALRYFVDYYGIAYPDAKVDLIAVPDFAMGAMENLGCITFREALLLIDATQATLREQMAVADVIAHELAHMWFGDLVTMRWWNGLWLNEAFATFMEIKATDAFRPEWRRWVAFGFERTAAFEVDGLRATRPIEFPVHSPNDAAAMFDVLTYEKGGAILRMLEQYLGEERFRDGIRHYLTLHAHDNAETSDLWDAIEAVTGEPVRKVMDSWVWQGGHPVISATISPDRRQLILHQQRFLFDGDDDGREWVVPIVVRQRVGQRLQVDRLLLAGSSTELGLIDPTATVVVNVGADGFYRTLYSPELLDRLVDAVFVELSPPERYQLIDDAWAAVVAGLAGVDSFLRLVGAFAEETELAVWQLILNGLRWCDRFAEGSAREHLRAFVRELLTPSVGRLGWARRPDESALTTELRGTLVRALAVLGNDHPAQGAARRMFDDPSVDPAMKAAAISVIAATGGAGDFQWLVARMKEAPTPQEELRYLYALAEFDDADLIEQTLTLAFSDSIRAQNAPYLIARTIANRNHGEHAWRFVRTHWEEATNRFAEASIIRMIDQVQTLTRPEQAADTAAFFAEHPIPQSAQTLVQVLERQRVNVALRDRATNDLDGASGSVGFMRRRSNLE